MSIRGGYGGKPSSSGRVVAHLERGENVGRLAGFGRFRRGRAGLKGFPDSLWLLRRNQQ